jgi:hypothetical protein
MGRGGEYNFREPTDSREVTGGGEGGRVSKEETARELASPSQAVSREVLGAWHAGTVSSFLIPDYTSPGGLSQSPAVPGHGLPS